MKTMHTKPVDPPRSVYNYFKREFIKYQSKFTNQMKTNWNATDVWNKLSLDEREKFRVKFEASKCQHEREYANYLSKLEPFMKKKRSCNSDTSTIEDVTIHDAVNASKVDGVSASSDSVDCARIDVHNQNNDGSQPAIVSLRQEEVSIQQELHLHGSDIIEDDTTSKVGGVSASSDIVDSARIDVHDQNNDGSQPAIVSLHQEEASIQQESHQHGSDMLENRESQIENPVPPPKDPKSLFMLTHEDILGREQCEDRWRIMPRSLKERYRSAMKSLQRTYIEKYRLYLTSLSDMQLAQHLQAKNINI